MLLKSIAAALGAVAFLAPLARGQQTCLNGALEGTLGDRYTSPFFEVVTVSNSWLVEVRDMNNPTQNKADTALTCDPNLTSVDPSTGWQVGFGVVQIPVQAVGIMDKYAMTYIEMLGKRNTIKKIQDPTLVVSPCIQKMIATGQATKLSATPDMTEAQDLGVIVTTATQGVPKAFLVGHNEDANPLHRAQMIKLYSLLYNAPAEGDRIYKQIEESYTNIQRSLVAIPDENKKRIAWVRYDYPTNQWYLQTTAFAMMLIQAAGGVPMGNDEHLNSQTPREVVISQQDLRYFLDNAQVVIDETEFKPELMKAQTPLDEWRRLAGYSSSELPKIIEKRQLYSLDREVNANGTSSYQYRVAARPDLLLMDVVMAQYPSFDLTYQMEFLRVFATTEGPKKTLSADDCPDPAQLTPRDIVTVQNVRVFSGDGIAPPALVGCSQFMDPNCSGDNKSGGGGGGISAGVIATVVVLAVVLASVFAFFFHRWNRRSKEEAFIELEDEMERDIPLRW
ncbi:hypothetical protein BGZ73_008498 [Actinomortierella ambigua]|nr:hypothetical protein BGZ73_008498 [Actinomortierella ambigua]